MGLHSFEVCVCDWRGVGGADPGSTPSLQGPAQAVAARAFAAQASSTAPAISWEDVNKAVLTDHGKRELQSLRSTFNDVNNKLKALAEVSQPGGPLLGVCVLGLAVIGCHACASPGTPGGDAPLSLSPHPSWDGDSPRRSWTGMRWRRALTRR